MATVEVQGMATDPDLDHHRLPLIEVGIDLGLARDLMREIEARELVQDLQKDCINEIGPHIPLHHHQEEGSADQDLLVTEITIMVEMREEDEAGDGEGDAEEEEGEVVVEEEGMEIVSILWICEWKLQERKLM
jgi:predicted transcriptional regulator